MSKDIQNPDRVGVAILKYIRDDRSVSLIKCNDGTFALNTMFGSGEDAITTSNVFTEETLLMILQASIVGLEYFGPTAVERMKAHDLLEGGVYEWGGCGELKLGGDDDQSVPATNE